METAEIASGWESDPTLGIVKIWDYLERQNWPLLKEKQGVDRIFVLSKIFNIKQNAAESWLVGRLRISGNIWSEWISGMYMHETMDLAKPQTYAP